MDQEHLDAALSRLYHTPDAPESFDTGWRAAVRREEITRMKTSKTHFFAAFRRAALPVLAAVVLVCGGLWGTTLNPSAPQSEPAAANGAVMTARSTAKDAVYMEETAYDTADYGAALVSGSTASASLAAPEAQPERKIVRNASLTIRTAQYDEITARLQETIAAMGGYVENLYQYGETVRRISYTLRIPSQRLDEFLAGAGSMGRVTDRSESTTDMTTQYVDNQARLDTLYAKRNRLNELLEKAENVSDLIEIENAIADAQYQIDRYETSQRSIDREVDMSYVNLTVVEETPASTVVADVSLGERLRAAFETGVEWLGEFAQGLLVFLTVILPAALPVAAIVLVWRLIARRRRNKEA